MGEERVGGGSGRGRLQNGGDVRREGDRLGQRGDGRRSEEGLQCQVLRVEPRFGVVVDDGGLGAGRAGDGGLGVEVRMVASL